MPDALLLFALFSRRFDPEKGQIKSKYKEEAKKSLPLRAPIQIELLLFTWPPTESGALFVSETLQRACKHSRGALPDHTRLPFCSRRPPFCAPLLCDARP